MSHVSDSDFDTSHTTFQGYRHKPAFKYSQSSPPFQQSSRKRQAMEDSSSPPPGLFLQHTQESEDSSCETEVGGETARKVYDTPELRAHILDSLKSTGTLAKMLRLEKRATASVAAVLYRSIHVSVVSKMSRATPRRVVYCNAVRAVDRSPRPRVEAALPKRQVVRSIPFEPISVHKTMTAYRKKYPNITTIKYEYPENDDDDSYIIHIRSDGVTLDLESHIALRMFKGWPAFDADGQLPAVPSFEGFPIVVHSLAVKLVQEPYNDELGGTQGSSARLACGERWKDWLFHNANLDKRINSIDCARGGAGVQPSAEDSLSFMTQRRDIGVPLRRFTGRTYDDDASEQDQAVALQRLAIAAGPHLRMLALQQPLASNHRDFTAGLRFLSDALPDLAVLEIHYDVLHKKAVRDDSNDSCRCYNSLNAQTISGFPSLRSLRISSTFIYQYQIIRYSMVSRYCLHYARGMMREVGSANCVFQGLQCRSITGNALRAFHGLVSDSK